MACGSLQEFAPVVSDRLLPAHAILLRHQLGVAVERGLNITLSLVVGTATAKRCLGKALRGLKG